MLFRPLPLSPARRRLLASAIAGAGLLAWRPVPAASPAGAAPDVAANDTAAGRLLVLDANTLAILEAFAEGSIVTGNGLPTVRAAGIARRIDAELHFVEPAIRDDFLLALRVADWLPVAYGHFSRLHRMSPADRRAFLDSLADTRFDTVRAIANGLHLITGLMYHAHPLAWAAMGYDGPHAHLPPRESEQQAYYRSITRNRP